jgi:hypothetical protein
VNQIEALARAGYLEAAPESSVPLKALAPLQDETVSREYRVRSWLAANCSGCHQPGTGVQARWDARISNPLAATGIINGTLFDIQGDEDMRVVTPGAIDKSMMFKRVSALGAKHMPPLATHLLDSAAIQLLKDWIERDLPDYQSFPEWQQKWFGSTSSAEAAEDADPDHDQTPNKLEFLLGTNPKNAAERWAFKIQKSGNGAELRFWQQANRGFEVQYLDNLGPGSEWKPLPSEENRPFISSGSFPKVLPDAPGAGTRRFYRARVYEP